MDALRTFFRLGRRFRRPEVQTLVAVEPVEEEEGEDIEVPVEPVEVPNLAKPVVDITDATVIFLLGYPSAKTKMTMFRAWASGDESRQLNSDEEEIQWSVCPASRFNPAADSDPNKGKFIFVQLPLWLGLDTTEKWLTNNWHGTPKDVGVISLDNTPFIANILSSWLMEFHSACKAANLNIHPLRTVFLSTGWTKENCRETYKRDREWIIDVKKDIRDDPDTCANMIRGELRFARLLKKDTAIAIVKLLFAPDSDS